MLSPTSYVHWITRSVAPFIYTRDLVKCRQMTKSAVLRRLDHIIQPVSIADRGRRDDSGTRCVHDSGLPRGVVHTSPRVRTRVGLCVLSTAIRGLPSIHLRPHWQDKCSITLQSNAVVILLCRRVNMPIATTASSPYVSGHPDMQRVGPMCGASYAITRILPLVLSLPLSIMFGSPNPTLVSWTEQCLVQPPTYIGLRALSLPSSTLET